MASKSTFYMGYGLVLNLGALFTGVSLYLNDKLRADLERIKGENRVKEHLREVHNRSAPRYDKFYGRVEIRNKINSYRKILTSYAIGDILETGCGTGKNFSFYKKTDKVIAVDYSEDMLEIANNKLLDKSAGDGDFNKINCDNITLCNLDCENLTKEFGKEKFDTVIDIMNFQAYIEDPEKKLDNFKSVVKNKGKLIILCRGQSEFILINFFYKIFRPTTIMKYGVEYSTNWDELFLGDDELKCLYRERKNLGKTYLYVFEVNKKNDLMDIEKNEDLGKNI
jgi:SAM-dependent methyltransferase